MSRMSWNRAWLRARLLVGVFLLATVLLTLHPQLLTRPADAIAHAEAIGSNPIQVENSKPGDPTWNDFASELQPDLISGYGSKISLNHGDSLDLFVTTTAPSFTIDIFRTGWYQGLGARLITSLGSFTGVHNAIPAPNAVTGMVVCNWPKTTTLTIPSDWVTGVYLARLNASNGNKSFIFFVVRNDGGHEDLVFQTSVTTYQAYNTYGGTSLYNNNTNQSVYRYPHATKVSFDRPFNPGDSNGAGHYFWWEYKFVRWAESQGYDLTYTTDVDTDLNTNPLTNHKAFLSVGHDEYWSMGMRTHVQQAIDAGVNIGFFSANTAYWQIRFESNASGAPDRVEVGYKDFADFNIAPGPDPMFGVNNSIVTTNWRDPVVNMPENGLMGVMYEQQVYQDETFVATNTSHWAYAGTGLVNGSKVPGIVGYEYDRVWNNGFSPPGLITLAHSPVSACCGTGNSFADTTIYTASSGARVFASGTIQWSLGLDNSQSNTYANSGIQKMTANLLSNFTGGVSQAVSASPSSLSFGQQNVGTTSASQQITLTNTGSSALTMNGITLAGANAGDFAQTNTCPASLAAGGSCVITATFSPTAAGARAASVTVASSALNSPLTIPLSGTGVSPNPAATLSPTSLSFGNQNVNVTSSPQAVTLTNSGGAALTISSITVTGTNASSFAQTNNCPASLAVGANCIINVTFTPDATGSNSANLTITDNASGSPQNVALSGNGVVPAPAASLSAASLSFGNQNVGVVSAAQSITLTNSGTAVLTISGISVTGTNASDFVQTNTCPASLAVGANCSISVTFNPGAAGNRSASLTITDNAANSPQSATLSGTGVTSVVYFSDDFESGNFSKWPIDHSDSSGTASVQTTVVNTGSHAASFSNGANQYVYIHTQFSGGAQSQTYTRFYFRLSSLANGTILAIGRNNDGSNAWEVDYDSNRHGLDIYIWTRSGSLLTISSANNVLNANTWYDLEVQDYQTTTGHGEVWLNGSTLGHVDGDMSMNTNYSHLMLFSNAQGVIYFDDVQVSSAFNGSASGATSFMKSSSQAQDID